ncbi:MAG TPA: TauD/TfdA family dioxygenase [Caulobacteraceae bacterium]|nr:TauD/TfdA family dioxygenase [Caulobacteraceae bacterium]
MTLLDTPPRLKIAPNPSGFGAEVTGLDLATPLPADTLEAVKTAFLAHGVLWFPDQPLTHDQLEAFTLQFGPFGWDPYVAPLADRPHILEVRREPDEKAHIFGGGWHSDWSFQTTPPSATILHAKVIPPVGGDTLYADGVAAYEALSPAFQAMLAPLRAIHSATRPYGPDGFFAREEGRKGMTILPSPEADNTEAHPLVRRLADGRRSLFVNPTYTLAIEGFSPAESEALLAFLYKHMLADAFIYRHRWAANMLTMWDNRRATHNAQGGYDGHLRLLHRTTVAGERPV